MNIPDNYDRWLAHEREQEKLRKELPVCDYCDREIQADFYYEINSDCICARCLDRHFKKDVTV